MKYLALLLVLLMIGAMIPVATVSAAVVKPVAQQAPALPVQKSDPFPAHTFTTLYATNYHPPLNAFFTLGGSVTSRYAGKVYAVPNNRVYTYYRYYISKTKSWEAWVPWADPKTDSNGHFSFRQQAGSGLIQFKATFRGAKLLFASTSNVITVYMGM